MNIPSGLSNREAFQLFDPFVVAVMAPERIEALVDLEERVLKLSGEIVGVDEAIAQYPEEDFLDPISERILALSKIVRAGTKAELIAILEDVAALALEVSRAGEYGIEHLRELEKTLADAGIGE